MLIVFPFSKNDLHLAVPLMAWIKRLGPYPRHDLLLAYSEELTLLERETVAMSARECGWRVPPMAIDCKIPIQRWPEAPNSIFAQVAAAVTQFNRPWMFVEPDCTPMVVGWADRIADEYNANPQLPFMGVIADTQMGLGGCSMQKVGEHLCGCAVYPPNIATYTTAHQTCTSAFDIVMGKFIRPHARNCAIMQDNWSTGNYRRDENGRIVCDPANLRVALSGGAVNFPVRPEVVFLHGCKDGSLIRLIAAETEFPKEITSKTEKMCGQEGVFTEKTEKPEGRKMRRSRHFRKPTTSKHV